MSMPQAFIIEDDIKLSGLYKTVLEQCQYETRVIDTGKEAQKVLQATSPDLIILDIHLPYISGIELLNEIQTDDRFDNTLIIVMTADIYTANELKGQTEHIILKTYGINTLRRLATEHIKTK